MNYIYIFYILISSNVHSQQLMQVTIEQLRSEVMSQRGLAVSQGPRSDPLGAVVLAASSAPLVVSKHWMNQAVVSMRKIITATPGFQMNGQNKKGSAHFWSIQPILSSQAGATFITKDFAPAHQAATICKTHVPPDQKNVGHSRAKLFKTYD